MSSAAQPGRPRPAGGSAVRWLAAPAVIVVVGIGLWFFGGVVAPGYVSSIVLSIAWFLAVAVTVGWVARRRPALRTPMRVTFLAVAAASAVGFYWTSIRDDRVNEAVVTGVAVSRAPASGSTQAPVANIEVARGDFSARAHSGRGTAAVVDLAGGGRKLTFTDFATDNGPDLRVYLVRGPVEGDGDVDEFVDLGRLKGNVGDQQYDIPEGTDLTSYSTVVVWCRAFSVNFTQAELRAS